MSTRPVVGVRPHLQLDLRLLRGRGPMLAAIVMAFIVGLAGTLWIGFELRYRDHVFPGVKTLGVTLGGASRAEAHATLTQLAKDYSAQWMTIRHGDRTWHAALSDLGIRLDVDRTLDATLAYGRGGSILDRLRDRWRAWREGVAVKPVLAFTDERWNETLTAVGGQIDRPARDARLVIESDARYRVEPSAEGQRVNKQATLQRLEQALATGRATEIVLVVERVRPAIVEQDWRDAAALVATMLRAPVTLQHEHKSWELSPQDLAPAIVPVAQLQGGSTDPLIKIDRDVLRRLVERVAGEIEKAPRNATLGVEGGAVVIVRGEVGKAVDVDATVAGIEQALRRSDGRQVPVVTREVMPRLTSQDLGPAQERAQQALGRPVIITYEGRRWTIAPATLLKSAQFVEVERDGRLDIEVRLDPQAARAALQPIAYAVERPARNARFALRGGQLVAIEPARDGHEVRMDEMVAALSAAIHRDERTIPLLTGVAKPQVTEQDVDKVVGHELIMDASTVYGGTLPARMYNIELAARRLNGTLVPPGGVFSFNRALGPQTLSNGFKTGYGIILRDGQPETVPSDAGGICQVATTLFHAVFWAGYKIEERHWHLYWIPRYGQPPRGRQGLDATVDDVYGIDFKFRNNTEHWLLIQAMTDGHNITFRLYGTKPDWDVQVEGPTITGQVKANTEIVEQVDPSLPPGHRLQIESAADGFRARFVRTVTRGGQIVDRWIAQSSYIPSRNVVLVGPQPAPQPAPAPEQPAAAPQPQPAPTQSANVAPAPETKPAAETNPAPQAKPTP
jgi:vancomycin resistance protein YoaR